MLHEHPTGTLESCQGHQKQRSYYRLEETKDTWQLNAIWDLELDLERKKNVSGKTGESQVTS